MQLRGDVDPVSTVVVDAVRHQIRTGDQPPSAPPSLRNIDVRELVSSATRHGVTPLVVRYLRNRRSGPLPERYAALLDTAVERITKRNLYLTTKLDEIIDTLTSRGIRMLPHKGPVLTQQLYGRTGLREYSDLDILVPNSEVARARELLLEQGFQPYRRYSEKERRAHERSHHHYLLTCSDTGLHVELHWRVSPAVVPTSMSLETVYARSRSVSFSGHEVAFPQTADLLLMLAAHGTNHRWKRLKWLADIAALLETETVNWSTVLDRAEALGWTRMVVVGVVLAHDLLDSPLPPDVRQLRQADGTIDRLVTRVAANLFDEDGESPTDFERLVFKARAQDTLADQLRVAARAIIYPQAFDFESCRVPDSLFWLYYLYRPFRLFGKAARRAVPSRGR